ncbi:MAG: hypothetical protein NTZ94_03805 [Verrucomicrobia bacterium]|nr:hypothetical protein [Verrucomicrobiota bacterium]
MSIHDDAILIRPAFDALYYLQAYPELGLDIETAIYHYLEHGWRQGRNPSADFSNNWYLTSHSDVNDAGINPLWHYMAAGKAEGRATKSSEEAGSAPSVCATSQHEDATRIALIATAFSMSHYFAQRPDVAQANCDPIEHYYYTGWREGVNPNKDFDTNYYLESNADVRHANVNPFWHYLVAGRAESRLGRRPGGYRREILEAAKEPWEREKSYKTERGRSLGRSSFQSRLTKLLKPAPAGLAVSISHDCYLSVVGGIQIFISDEQKLYDKRGYDYIHISPATPKLTFRGSARETFLVRIAAAGQIVGVLRLTDFLIVLRSIATNVNPREFSVHHFFGFGAGDICLLYDALTPSRSVYWLHDYSSICEGYNLLRNDIALCGAPPPNSMSCRVCVYGDGRAAHQQWVDVLFRHCNFEVASPSVFTMEFWKSHSTLPYNSISMHPHSQLHEDASGGRRQRGLGHPVRLAFVGFPTASKGWPIFSALADRLEHDQRYSVYHFAASHSPTTSAAKFVAAEVTTKSRHAMVDLLREHQIDFVLVGSVWPETFSYVTYEAIAAGCAVLCFEDSGNVRSLVESTCRGQVFPNIDALFSFFRSDDAIDYLNHFRPANYRIINNGTTATLPLISVESAVI